MRSLLGLLLVFLLPVLAKAQSHRHFEVVRIHVPNQDLALAIANGAAPDHHLTWIGDTLELPLFDVDLSVLEQSPLGYRILPTTENASTLSARTEGDCAVPLRFDFDVPDFELGSMNGGYYSFQDTWEAFANMRQSYPNLISEPLTIEPFRTYEGREINYFRLSDNPDTQEDEPRVMLNALHHAREPLSLIQQVYFAWWLLSNYGVDEEVTWLLDHTELYLVPIVNPDGYAYNGAEGGTSLGLWRKNRRDNGDGTFGVDLNRNYTYGFGGPGSTDDTGSDIYRGIAPLSEPETQALDFLHRALNFTTILNAHSFSDLVIHADLEDFPTAQQARIHQELSWAMRRDNRYGVGNERQTVGYTASGDAGDYFSLYESPGKALALSFIPEIGERLYGFLPPRQNVERYAREALLTNWRALQSPHFTPVVELTNTFLERVGELTVRIANISASDGSADLEVSSTNPAIIFEGTTFPVELRAGSSRELSIPYRIVGTLPDALEALTIDFPSVRHVKPLEITQLPIYGAEVLYQQALNDNEQEVFGVPVAFTRDAFHPRAITVSGPNSIENLTIPVSLPEEVLGVRVSFSHRFQFRSNTQNVTLSAGNNTRGFQQFCSNHTSTVEPSGVPAYWGTSPGFVDDSYLITNDNGFLTDFLNGTCFIRWNFDNWTNPTYSYELDDIRIEALVAPSTFSSTVDLVEEGISAFPNPTTGVFTLLGIPGQQEVTVYNSLGQHVWTTLLQNSHLDLSHLPKGQYLVSVVENGAVETVRVSLR